MSELVRLGVIVHEIKLSPNKVSIFLDFRYLIALFKIIRQTRPDVFFAYTIKPIVYGNLVASICKVKTKAFLFSGLGYSFQENGTVAKKLVRGLLKFNIGLRTSKIYFFQNQDDKIELTGLGILNKSSIVHVVDGSGVDLNEFCYQMPDVHNITFVMVARLVNAKGIKEFYEASKIIKAKYKFVKFWLLGEHDIHGIDSISLDLYNEIKYSEVIEYHGWIEDVKPFLRNSSVIVLPSYYKEGIPRSILEAMSVGRPVITTNSVGCRETVNSFEGNINGFLVPPKDVSALHAKMEFFINNPHKIIEYGINSRHYAEERFDVHKVNKQMIDALKLT